MSERGLTGESCGTSPQGSRAESSRCRLFHSWGRWGASEVADWKRDGERVGSFVYQRRECERCGMVAQRTVAG